MTTVIPAAPSMAAASASAITSLATTAVAAAAAATTTAPWDGDGGSGGNYQDQVRGQRDLYTQIVISLALGFGAFLTFCVSCDDNLLFFEGGCGMGRG